METNKIIPAMINGVIIGFTIGAGFMLAKRLFEKKTVVVAAEPVVEKRVITSDRTMTEFAGFNASGTAVDNMPLNDFLGKNFAPPSRRRDFDFTTGNLY